MEKPKKLFSNPVKQTKKEHLEALLYSDTVVTTHLFATHPFLDFNRRITRTSNLSIRLSE